jgi:hypothetical protein
LIIDALADPTRSYLEKFFGDAHGKFLPTFISRRVENV